MDIDHFKQYNDTYGHQKGDKVLIKVAKAIKDLLKRADDYCFRLGGEEFGIIFKSNSKEMAEKFATHIKENIENLHIEHKKNSASEYITVVFKPTLISVQFVPLFVERNMPPGVPTKRYLSLTAKARTPMFVNPAVIGIQYVPLFGVI